MQEKMKAVERHITTLLNVQQANRSALRQKSTKAPKTTLANCDHLDPAEQSAILSVKNFLKEMVSVLHTQSHELAIYITRCRQVFDRVHSTKIRTMYDQKLSESRSLANELKAEVQAYKALQEKKLQLAAAIELRQQSSSQVKHSSLQLCPPCAQFCDRLMTS